ncbi:hypothetical protein Enr13x_16040 [Stieleria neptunia]|uniref:Uncharacterized protein n=1 Tax=Stieleria neptunia TaxID=2527979 RepID=A0A518HLM9_9BACT|nr:hypothetical protein [Stieleria neptunia]QDV41761.1 hypothetical protein Enr13x_16040 [Stieleria neptunia]
MPTRPTRSHLNTPHKFVKRRQLRAAVVGLTAGLALGWAGVATADGAIQLTAPANVTAADAAPSNSVQPDAATEVLPAETAWTKRPGSTTAAAARESAAAAGDDTVAPSASKTIPATPASGPLDRFRGALPSLPAIKPAAPSIPTPGDVELDNADAHRSSHASGALPTQPDASQDRDPAQPTRGSSAAVTEGGWVARDAINRVSPLRDPVANRRDPVAKSSPPVVEATTEPAPTTRLAPTQPSRDDFSKRDRSQPQSQPQSQYVSPSRSMSLGEAKSAVDSTRAVPASELPLLPPPDANTPADGGDDEPATSLNATQGRPANDTAQPLPKRKPLTNLVESTAAAVKKEATKDEAAKEESAKPSRQSVDRKSADDPGASASIGDLQPGDSQVLDYSGRPAAEITPTPTVKNMRRGIERILTYFYQRPEIATGRSNWGMMHSMMVFGADTKVAVGRQHFSTIAWIAGNNNCRGQRLLTHDANGIQAKSGVGLQGHQGQFLAVLGMCNVPTDYPLYAGKMKYDVTALIESEKRACKAGEELTFTLIGLSHYLDTDSRWVADDGTRWDFERLIEEELKQPIVGSACGGTHRLMGYTHALRKRRAEGKPITGQWKRAEIFTDDFVNYAYSLQNRDGSMSTNWFDGRADNGNVDRKVQTTGHIVEWLLTVTPDDQLQDRRLVAAVAFLLRSMGSDLDHDWSIGPKGHALRSLAMYHQRVFRAGTPWIPESLADSARQSRGRR